jgi:hypothetical protein
MVRRLASSLLLPVLHPRSPVDLGRCFRDIPAQSFRERYHSIGENLR